MELMGAASRASTRGPADWLTGQVWMDEIAILPDRRCKPLCAPTQPSTAPGWTWRAMAASNQAPGRVRVNASGSRLTALAPRASIDLMRKASRTWT
jgi:hypothetical protein